MTIVVKRPWTRQPPPQVPIAAPYRSARSMVWAPGCALAVAEGTLNPSINLGGRSQYVNNNVARRLSFTSSISSGNVTLIAAVSFRSIAPPQSIGGLFLPGTPAIAQYISIESGGPICAISTDSNNWSSATGPVAATNRLYFIVASFVSGGGRKLFINGALVATNTTARSPTGMTKFTIGCYDSGSSGPMSPINGDVYTFVVLPVALSDAECLRISANPGRVFAPQQIIIPYAAAAPTVPTLSDLRAVNVTANSAQWSIDYSF